jgi:hypothetical protein
MRASTTSTAPASKRKRPARKTSAAVLSMCPVNGAGWCPYPFSPAQLQKRMKAKMAADQKVNAKESK